MTVSLAIAGDADSTFLRELYRSSRAGEMASWGWGRDQQELFLQMQFSAREGHYRVMYPERDDRVIFRDGRPVGRLIVARRPGEIVLVDIALLPDQQGRCVGTTLVRELQREAGRSGRPLRLHVLGSSAAAIRLYERLDFRTIDDDGSHFLMEWQPPLRGSEE